MAKQQTLPPNVQEMLRDAIRREGLAALANRAGASRQAVSAAAAGCDVRAGTRALIVLALENAAPRS